MRASKSLLNVVGVSMGGIGTALCIALMVILWIANARLGRVTDGLFDQTDRALIGIRQRVDQTRDRVGAARINTADIEKSLRDWTKQAAAERLKLRVKAAENTDRLASTLQQADDWLDVSESAAGLVEGVFSIANSRIAAADTISVDDLIAQIGSLRAQLADARDAVAKLHQRIVEVGDENPTEGRIQQAAQLALRVVATVGSLDSRFQKLDDHISAVQGGLGELKTRARRWILAATIGVALLILWMAAGQVALCRLAWNGWRGTASTES